MRPIIKIRLFKDDEKIAELETEFITKIYDLFKWLDFDYGIIRVTYNQDFYNEATFITQAQCKVLALVFREKPLLEYIYKKEL